VDRLFFAIGLVAILVGNPAAAEPSPPAAGDARACDAALATVKMAIAQRPYALPWIVADYPASRGPGDFGGSGNEQRFLMQQWQGEGPARELARALVASQPRSVLGTCPMIGTYLDRTGIRHGDAAVIDAIKTTGQSARLYSAAILSVSLPIIASDGDEAVVEIGVTAGWTSGGGLVLHLRRRSNGDWAEVGGLPTW
jgi:hypothetical protein